MYARWEVDEEKEKKKKRAKPKELKPFTHTDLTESTMNPSIFDLTGINPYPYQRQLLEEIYRTKGVPNILPSGVLEVSGAFEYNGNNPTLFNVMFDALHKAFHHAWNQIPTFLKRLEFEVYEAKKGVKVYLDINEVTMTNDRETNQNLGINSLLLHPNNALNIIGKLITDLEGEFLKEYVEQYPDDLVDFEMRAIVQKIESYYREGINDLVILFSPSKLADFYQMENMDVFHIINREAHHYQLLGQDYFMPPRFEGDKILILPAKETIVAFFWEDDNTSMFKIDAERVSVNWGWVRKPIR